MIDEKKLSELKEIACHYMDSLSEIRQADFNAGQAYAIKLMFHWIEKLKENN